MWMRPRTRVNNRASKRHNATVMARVERVNFPAAKRALGGNSGTQRSHFPPETWHEPQDDTAAGFRVVVERPGSGFCHVVSEADIRARLAQLPPELVRPLQVVQLSRMTAKKKTFPCYGMQWGSTIYLYPMEEGLIENFRRPPTPAQKIEARMYGGQWCQPGPGRWQLVWTLDAIRNYYLNNILLHELGHLLDNRNTSYRDRERYAEWFAIEHGHKRPSQKAEPQKA